jgi:hypothetical protein
LCWRRRLTRLDAADKVTAIVDKRTVTGSRLSHAGGRNTVTGTPADG